MQVDSADANTIIVRMPAAPAGESDIVITFANGTVVTSPTKFKNLTSCERPVLSFPKTELTITRGDSVTLAPVITSGTPPFTFLWYQQLGANSLYELNGSGPSFVARPTVTRGYSVRVSNGCGAQGSMVDTHYLVIVLDPPGIAPTSETRQRGVRP